MLRLLFALLPRPLLPHSWLLPAHTIQSPTPGQRTGIAAARRAKRQRRSRHA